MNDFIVLLESVSDIGRIGLVVLIGLAAGLLLFDRRGRAPRANAAGRSRNRVAA